MPWHLKSRIDDLGDVVWRAGTVQRSSAGGKQFQLVSGAVLRVGVDACADASGVGDAERRGAGEQLVYGGALPRLGQRAFAGPELPLPESGVRGEGDRHLVSYLARGDCQTATDRPTPLPRPDFARQSPANPVFRVLNRDCNPLEWTSETGQLLVNKLGQGGLNLVALVAAESMQRDQEHWFRLSNGDKDTFRYGFWFLGEEYTPAPHYLAAAGATTKESKGHTL